MRPWARSTKRSPRAKLMPSTVWKPREKRVRMAEWSVWSSRAREWSRQSVPEGSTAGMRHWPLRVRRWQRRCSLILLGLADLAFMGFSFCEGVYRGWSRRTIWDATPRHFCVRADSKEVTGGIFVRTDSKGLMRIVSTSERPNVCTSERLNVKNRLRNEWCWDGGIASERKCDAIGERMVLGTTPRLQSRRRLASQNCGRTRRGGQAETRTARAVLSR